TWDAVSGATSYNVLRADSADGVYLTTGIKVSDTSFVDAFVQPEQTYHYAVSANKDQDISGRSESISASAGKGMVAQWTFDETSGTQMKDSGPFDLQSSTIGNIALVDGKQGKAISLEERSYVSVPQNLARWGLNDFTLTAWIKTSATGNDGFNENTPGIMGSWGDPSNGTGFIVGGLDSSGKIGARIDYNGDVVRSEQSVNDGEWHHVAITRDDATNEIQVFVDGQLSTTGTSGDPERNSRAWSIGRVDYSMQSFPGSLDDVRMYNRPLSASEIEQLYQGSNN
ncbi:MAG: LamG domain-containing protein, partial [Chloroflexota bacterium]